MGDGGQEATPIVYARHDVRAEPRRLRAGVRRGDRASSFWEYKRKLPEGCLRRARTATMAIWGTTLIDAGERQHALRDRRSQRASSSGKRRSTSPKTRARATSGPIIAKGRVITGRQCQPEATHEACVVTAHDAATGRELWRARTIPRPGEPGDEKLGRRADGAALARRHVDGAELRSGARSDLRRHVRDDSGREVHSRRHATRSTCITTRRSRSTSRHGRIGLVLPTSRRPLGSRPSVRAPASRHARRTGCGRSGLDEPATCGAGERRQVVTGIPGKTRHRLHARSRDRRVPMGTANDLPERHQQHRRRNGAGHGRSRARLHAQGSERSSFAPA